MSASAAAAAEFPLAGVGRRFGAMLYDSLALIAVLALTTLFLVPFMDGKVMVVSEVGWIAHAYRAFQVAICSLFFAFFWTRIKGQTLGMQAWRLRIETGIGERISWGQAFARMGILWALTIPPLAGYWMLWRTWQGVPFVIACTLSSAPIVACYASIWFSKDRLAWHDRWTRTRMVVLPKL